MQANTKRKKVLHILYSGLGGHGNVLFSLIDADRQNEFEYECLFFGTEEIRPEYEEMANDRSLAWHYVKKRKWLDFTAFRKIMRIVRKADPDIIFLHASTYLFPVKLVTLGNFKKRRIIIRETQANHLKTKTAWLWLRIALMYPCKVVFLTNEYKEEVKNRFRRIFKENKTAVIPNGIDLEIFRPAESQPANEIIFGMQSRLVNIKDHITLIEAFSRLRAKMPGLSMKLKIAGDGEYRAVLENKVADLKMGNEVEFTGILNETELVSFINSLSFYVHASLGETMSTAIMQAMACKKSIIASDVPGIKNMIVHGETGVLVGVKDIDAMETAMLRLINDRQLARQLADAAHQFAQDHFSNSLMFNRYKALFNS